MKTMFSDVLAHSNINNNLMCEVATLQNTNYESDGEGEGDATSGKTTTDGSRVSEKLQMQSKASKIVIPSSKLPAISPSSVAASPNKSAVCSPISSTQQALCQSVASGKISPHQSALLVSINDPRGQFTPGSTPHVKQQQQQQFDFSPVSLVTQQSSSADSSQLTSNTSGKSPKGKDKGSLTPIKEPPTPTAQLPSISAPVNTPVVETASTTSSSSSSTPFIASLSTTIKIKLGTSRLRRRSIGNQEATALKISSTPTNATTSTSTGSTAQVMSGVRALNDRSVRRRSFTGEMFAKGASIVPEGLSVAGRRGSADQTVERVVDEYAITTRVDAIMHGR
jgi:hypothetical protein